MRKNCFHCAKYIICLFQYNNNLRNTRVGSTINLIKIKPIFIYYT